MPKQNDVRQAVSPCDLPLAVKYFDQLPDHARINSRCLKILLCISDTTFWRRRKDSIADPDVNGTWSVQYVRQLLNCEVSK